MLRLAVAPVVCAWRGFPRLVPVRRNFLRPCLEDPVEAARAEMRRLEPKLRDFCGSGARVAVAVGSRGIAGLPAVLRAVIEELRRLGAEPYLVSAMGSHGGGTAEGQRAVLASLGITEAAVGAPLRITDETVEVARTPDGFPVHCDAEAAAADGIFLVNRVKAHTAFRGPNESGLLKMMAIGLGKVPGATAVHHLGPSAMARAVPMAARLFLTRMPVLGGLAVVENGYEETAAVHGLYPEEMEEEEQKLLTFSKSLLPGLPAGKSDILIIDEMGKNFSGTGMDTNVIGRWGIPGFPEPPEPMVGRIIVLGLSEETHGNANGVGLADIITARLAGRIDFSATYLNVVTTTYLQRARLPLVAADDRSALALALALSPESSGARVARISNTLHLETVWVSENLVSELLADDPKAKIGDPAEVAFDPDGRLI